MDSIVSVLDLKDSKYKLYGFLNYENSAGLDRCILKFNTIEELIPFFSSKLDLYDEYQILNVCTSKVVWFEISTIKPFIVDGFKDLCEYCICKLED